MRPVHMETRESEFDTLRFIQSVPKLTKSIVTEPALVKPSDCLEVQRLCNYIPKMHNKNRRQLMQNNCIR